MFFLLLYSCFYLPPCLPNDMKSPSFGKTNDLVNVSELLLKSSTAVRFCNVTTRRRHKKLEHNRGHGQWTRDFQRATSCNWCLFPLMVKYCSKPTESMNLCNYCTMVDYDTAPRAFTKHLMWKHTQHRVWNCWRMIGSTIFSSPSDHSP